MVSAMLVLATTASVVTATQANAAPPAKDIGYSANIVGDHVVLKTDIGSLRTSDGQFQIVDNKGNVAASIPLAYNLNDKQFPINAYINGRTATLTPVRDAAAAQPIKVSDAVRKQAAAPATREQRDMQAMQTLSQSINTASAVGGLVGTIVGGIIGCVVGLPAGIVGCLPGIVTGAGIGGVVGTIVVGGPVLIGAAIQFFNTINSPFVPPAN
ncbi:hypothetical protein CSW57_15410 [Williamsia muralis]|uniref:DUF8020 domain-containing protein n=1 Tax=Williamsia marianensis TaxID=85044 RepID=A0A2G3PHD5_WILMA|nr:hypothetical protein CSW57_15410 [Williamsia marianensis]